MRFAGNQLAAAEQALALALPMLGSAMPKKPRVGESGLLRIVVMEPRITPHAARFEDVVLYEQIRRSRCAAK